jgi:hypothetical protein
MTYEEGLDNQEENFLIDFLYVDKARIQTLSSQLFPNGHLTHLKQSASSTSTSKMGVDGGVPAVFKATGNLDQGVSESVERQFDATWSTTLDVLRELNEQKFIAPDIENALLGQIVQIKGSIQVADLRMFEKLWEPMITLDGAQKLASAKGIEKVAVKAQLEEAKRMCKIIQLLPHILQMRLHNEENASWSSLQPEFMTINPIDLLFKHGAYIPGEWTAIGVLDAKPSNSFEEQLTAILSSAGSGISSIMPEVFGGLRTAFGRADQDFGITPIAVYRKVTSHSQ